MIEKMNDQQLTSFFKTGWKYQPDGAIKEMARGLQRFCDENPQALKAKELLAHMQRRLNAQEEVPF